MHDNVRYRGVISRGLRGRELRWIEAAFMLSGIMQVVADGSVPTGGRVEEKRDEEAAMEILGRLRSRPQSPHF